MKGTFKVLALLLTSLFVIVWAVSCQESTATSVSHSKKSPSDDFQKIYEISDLRKEVQKIEREKLGVCDTCKTGFRSIIIENRLLANQLAEQNARMIQILDSNEVEIKRIQQLHYTNKKIRKDYELKYALANNQTEQR